MLRNSTVTASGNACARTQYCVECYAEGRTQVATRRFHEDPVCQPCYSRLCKEAGIAEEKFPQGSVAAPSPVAKTPPAIPQPQPAEAAAKPKTVSESELPPRGRVRPAPPPLAPAQEKKPMDQRKCRAPEHGVACETPLMAHNKSGYCSKHFYLSKLKAKPTAQSKPITAGEPLRNGHTPAATNGHAKPSDDSEAIVTVQVKAFQLDRFWLGLSVEEKAQIFSQYMQREA